MREKLEKLREKEIITEEEYTAILNIRFDSKGKPIELSEEDEKLYDVY